MQWLGVQLDEEQQAAEEALKKTTTTRRRIGGQWVEDKVQPPEWRRSAWSPARVLREIDAKRQLVGQLAEADPDAAYITGTFTAWDALRLLALPYSDRPGYREEWRP